MKKKKENNTITINKKVLAGIAPAVAILGVLVSKHEPGPILLFLVGIAVGLIIGVNWKDSQK